MQTNARTRILGFKLLSSLIGINCAFFIAYQISFNNIFDLREMNIQADYKLLFMTANLLIIIINLLPARRSENGLRNYALFLVSYMALIVFYQGYEYSRMFHLYLLATHFFFCIVSKYTNLTGFLEKYLLPGNVERKILLIGEDIDKSFVNYLNSRQGNYRCVGFLSDNNQPPKLSENKCFGQINAIDEILYREAIDEVVILNSLLSLDKIDHIIKVSERYHATVNIIPPYFQYLSKQSCQIENWMGVPVTAIYHSKLGYKSYQIGKRVLDICISLVFLLTIFPLLFLIVAPAIWLSNKGPIFFKQLRKGYKQEPFFCYKFRTMTVGNKSCEIQQAKRHDPRVTSIGRKLRNTSVDEFPQFLNVLAGKMSIVGPRPHMVEHDEIYDKFIERYNIRFVTKPGITGWAQVNGFRGATEKSGLMEKRIEYDLWYIKNYSIWLDVKIIALTAISVLFKGDPNAY